MTEGKDGDTIDDLRAFLEEKASAPNPSRKVSLKATIAALRPQLVALKDAGYTDVQIAELLGEKGIVINAGTLKNYMSQTRDTTQAPASKPRRTKPASADQRNDNSTATPSQQSETPVAKPAPTAPGTPRSLTRDPRKPL